MRRAILLVCAVALALAALLVPAQAQAQPSTGATGGRQAPDEYATDSEAWNGLATFDAVVRGLGLQLEHVSRIDWEEIDSGDIVFVMWPNQRLEPAHVSSFLLNGGRMMIADDFGESAEALAQLGMLRQHGVGVGAERFHDDLAYAPIAEPVAHDHPLAKDVDELATNYPAVFTHVQGPRTVFAFAKGEAVVAAGSLGPGRFVVASDPSIFINRMMQFQGNLQFTINLIRFLSRNDETTRVILLTGRFDMYGEPSRPLDDVDSDGKLGQLVGDFNRWLYERNEYLLTEPGLRAIAIVVAVLIALMAMTALPLSRRSDLDGSWTRAHDGNTHMDDFEHLVRHFDKASHTGNYLLPATVLRDGVNNALSRALDQPEPLYTVREDELGQSVGEHCGAPAKDALNGVYKRLKPLPSRVQAASPWTGGYLSRREFERLHNDVAALYRTLGVDTGPRN